MPVKLTVSLPMSSADMIAGYGANPEINFERDTLPTFPAPTAPALSPLPNPIVIQLGQEQYETYDLTGTPDLYYRAWFSRSDGTNPSEYSEVKIGRGDTYATIDDVLITLDKEPENTRFLNRIAQVLEAVTDEITRDLGMSFFRQPLTGIETRYFSPEGTRLHVHEGIISITSLSVGAYGQAGTVISSVDYRTESLVLGDPWDHLELSPAGASYQEFAEGRWGVALTGVFGYSSVPVNIRESAVEWARATLNTDASPGGGQLGPEEYGRPVVLARLPDYVWRTYEHYKRRYAHCYIA